MKNLISKTKQSSWILKGIFTVIFLSVLLVFYPACGKKDKPENRKTEYSEKTAELVSHITTGFISASDEIFVRFVHPLDEALKDSAIKENLFVFEPGIEGISRWRDNQTLVFRPATPLKLRQKYQGSLDISSLFPKHKGLQKLKFEFEVSGREISFIKADFEVINPNDPDRLFYRGSISFSQPIALEKVSKSVTLYQGTNQLELTWEEKEREKTFNFQSGTITRSNASIPFTLEVQKETTELSEKYSNSFNLEPLQDFKLVEVVRVDQGKQSGIKIKFSDQLDPNQDITGLVSINREPKKTGSAKDLGIRFKKVGKSIFIDGNFVAGETYELEVSNIRSKWGTKLKTKIKQKVIFKDQKPQISFTNDGAFLPSINEKKITFKSMNVKNVYLEITKVFESNLGQFLQSQNINAQKGRNDEFDNYYINRVGVTVARKKLEIGETKNKWLIHELDLNKLITKQEKGLFLIKLYFQREDMLYAGLTKKPTYYYGRDRYSNPNSYSYMWRHSKVFKPLVLSDIGLTYKKGIDQHLVYASNLVTSEPENNVKITLRTYQNQILQSKNSDSDGLANFNNIKDKVFYIEAEKNGQRSFIQPKEMGWNISSFDTGGVNINPEETRLFIYTERGVYRPGDQINLSFIARNKDRTFPNDHPVQVKITNPKNQLMFKKTLNKGTDGFYNLNFRTKEKDLTGNWKAAILVGSRTFFHTLKIETVVPNRLKVIIKTKKQKLDYNDKFIDLDLISNYLFGNPAAFLSSEVAVTLNHKLKTYSKFPGFSFTNDAISFKSLKTNIFNSSLDENGQAKIVWTLPKLEAPSSIAARITAKVFEKGGRATRNDHIITIDPYKNYVGLQKPAFKYGYCQVGSTFNINALLVNIAGHAIADKGLSYKVYKNSRYWWWEYSSRTDFRVRYKKDSFTRLVKEGTVQTKNIPVAIEFKPEDTGEYFIEVSDESQQGHTAGFFFSAYYWGDAPGSIDSAGILTLKSDKKVYQPGDKAKISFPTPRTGNILVTVEKGNKIVDAFVKGVSGDKQESSVEIPVSEELLPNGYVTISVVQPHEESLNDRPLRMYGVIPLLVEQPQTRHPLTITMADELESNKPFTVKVQTTDKQPTQFTIAVVDEGLLDLTNFKTPDPWQSFFQKQRLMIQSFDLFSFVIGGNKGDVFRLFSIGGDFDMEEEYRRSQSEPKKAKRFKPVSMFKGPLQTDEKGFAEISFNMPNYIGSVRVMVVACKGTRYGNGQKTVPVKTDLMILPTIPRVLGPGDRFSLPVTVFAIRDNIKKADVSLNVNGPLEIVGINKFSLAFEKPSEQDIKFEIRVLPAVGNASLNFRAKSGKIVIDKKVEINIRPSSPRIYSTEVNEVSPGKKITMQVPNRGVSGTNEATITVMRKKNLNLGPRIYWLIRYPYGCIEQTVSAVFPQLYLKNFIKNKDIDEAVIDANINQGILKLRNFQTSAGGLSYWPGNRYVSGWGTNYAHHFLIEAKELGYNVPSNLLDAISRFQKSMMLTTRDNLLTRIYRLYILALAGDAQIGPMNLVKENDLRVMNDTEKWLLACCYYLAEKKDTAQAILKTAGKKVGKYIEFGGTYGSWLRDKAIMLEIAMKLKNWRDADYLYDEISEEISSRNWYSTQTLAYSLLAVGKYLKFRNIDARDPRIAGYIKFRGRKIKFDFEDLKFTFPITEGFGENLEVHLDPKTTLDRVFVNLAWNGIPLRPDASDESKNLWLNVKWLDENGVEIDPGTIKQGASFYGHFRVGSTTYRSRVIDEVALVQILPSGWEIDNTRLTNEQNPNWMKKWYLNRQEYTDIRDDRIMWFFDLPGGNRTLDFVVKIQAVTQGDFVLPPSLVEAMYNNNYKAIKKGRSVRVTER